MASALPTSSLCAELGLDRLDHYTRDLKTFSMRTILKKLLRSGVKRSEWSGRVWCCGGSGFAGGWITPASLSVAAYQAHGSPNAT